MWPITLIIIYSSLLIIASLAGGWLPSMIRLTHTRMQLMMSLVGGLMMGVALLHLLPHAAVQANSLDYAAWSCMLGLLAMFLTIRVFNVHQHGPPEHHQEADHAGAEGGHDHHDCRHPATRAKTKPRSYNWLGLFIGLAIHSVLDGVAVGASLVAGVAHGATAGFIGAGTFLAVFLHKPLDSLSITSVMVAGQWDRRSQSIVNLLFALICPAGALLTFVGVRSLGQWQHVAVGCALGFSAGVFLCISLADILPEIQFHQHDRIKLTATLLVGVALALVIGIFEPKHVHDYQPQSPGEHRDHDDHGHQDAVSHDSDALHDHEHDHATQHGETEDQH